MSCGHSRWRTDGCRIQSYGAASVTKSVFPIKPRFVFFPADTHITTHESHAPDSTGTGRPTGTSFASTPMEIYHTDTEPLHIDDSDVCVWVITRTWTIRAVHQQCTEGIARESPTSTSQDQRIFISDVTPPVFILPQLSQVEFHSNRGGPCHVHDVPSHGACVFLRDPDFIRWYSCYGCVWRYHRRVMPR